MALQRTLFRRSSRTFFGLAIAGALIFAACGDDDAGTPAIPSPSAEATAAQATPEGSSESASPAVLPPGEIDVSSPSTIEGADPEFNYTAMVWQGYWLSRDHFGPLAMGSGMGMPFAPPMEMIQMAMQMVAQNPDDQPFVPDNIAPLMAVFRSADTALVTDMTAVPPSDFSGMRLDPATFEEVIGVEGQAQLMLKESQWARNFHLSSHFGEPDADFGAQQRFTGMMVSMLAQMQGQFAMDELLNPDDGLYYDSDGTLDYRGNWTLLQAFADIAGITGDESLRYHNPDIHEAYSGATGMLLNALSNRNPDTAGEAASAARALAYVAWTANDDMVRSAALERLGTVADGLEAMSIADVPGQAAAIVGLVTAAQALDDASLNDAAEEYWQALASDFQPQSGTFASMTRYTTDEVAWIIGGLNSITLAGPSEVRPESAQVLLAFYEALLNQSGMQISAPPGKSGAMSGPFEENLPSVVYYHGRETPPPPTAGGEFGRLMLPAAEVEYADGAWDVTDYRFESAGGMHLANELNWLGPHLGSVPFPDLRGDDDGATNNGNTAAASTSWTIRASSTAFDLDTMVVPSGETITVTFVNEDEDIPHNLHVAGAGVDAETEIFPGSDGGSRELEFSIGEPGEYTFVCDVHPSQMTGVVIVE